MQIVRTPDRFDLVHDGAVIGTLTYSRRPDAIVLDHIEVDASHSGQGLAAWFTDGVLTQVRDGQESVIPKCPYVRGHILKHPQWRTLVAADDDLSA